MNEFETDIKTDTENALKKAINKITILEAKNEVLEEQNEVLEEQIEDMKAQIKGLQRKYEAVCKSLYSS